MWIFLGHNYICHDYLRVRTEGELEGRISHLVAVAEEEEKDRDRVRQHVDQHDAVDRQELPPVSCHGLDS